jgi:drug/metabolite transporter (DMT)-like permease
MSKIMANSVELNHFYGIILSISSSFLFALYSILTVKITIFTSVEQVGLVCCISVPSYALIAFKNGLCPFGGGYEKVRKLILIRSVIGSLNMILLTTAYRLAQPSDVKSVCFTTIIFVIIISRLYFKDKIGIFLVFIPLLLTIAGVLFILQPSFIFTSKVYKNNDTNSSLT